MPSVCEKSQPQEAVAVKQLGASTSCPLCPGHSGGGRTIVALVTQLRHLCRQRTCESCVAPVQAEVTNVRRRDLGHVRDEAGDKQDVRGSRGLANAEERRLQGRRAVLHGLSAASGGAPESHGESGPLAAASAQALSPAGLKSVPGPEWCEAAQSPDTHRGAWRAPELTVLPAMAGVCERESLCLQPEGLQSPHAASSTGTGHRTPCSISAAGLFIRPLKGGVRAPGLELRSRDAATGPWQRWRVWAAPTPVGKAFAFRVPEGRQQLRRHVPVGGRVRGTV